MVHDVLRSTRKAKHWAGVPARNLAAVTRWAERPPGKRHCTPAQPQFHSGTSKGPSSTKEPLPSLPLQILLDVSPIRSAWREVQGRLQPVVSRRQNRNAALKLKYWMPTEVMATELRYVSQFAKAEANSKWWQLYWEMQVHSHSFNLQANWFLVNQPRRCREQNFQCNSSSEMSVNSERRQLICQISLLTFNPDKLAMIGQLVKLQLLK